MFNKQKITAFLRDPVVDKVLGVIAVLPLVYTLYIFVRQVSAGNFDIYHAAVSANSLFIVVSMTVRRTATRISLNPVFWFVTAGRSYWAYLVLNYVYVYNVPTNAIQVLIAHLLLFVSIVLIVYSRFSLGRNIGYLPARRTLVTTGAYGYVRHPIHSGELLFFLSYMLLSFTFFNFFLLAIGIVFVIWKSFVEEHFLREDADYREYCEHVRWRWVPGLI